jgi:hypothetical protein
MRAAWGSEPVNSIGLVEARAFLDEYRTSGASEALGFYDLYSDRAVIHTRVEGREHGLAFQGRAYKAWGRDLLQSRRAAPDASEFYDPTVEIRGRRLVIRAARYSLTRCFWDRSYQVGLEKEGPSYRIIDERLTFNPSAVCAAALSSNTPVMASGTTVAIRDPRFTTKGSSWRPLTQEEIAESALRLAQQAAAKYPAPAHGTPATPATVIATPATVLGARRVESPSDLWVTPQE